MPLTVAIDGPAGAGKSTVAGRVAAALALTYIDTGAMYRAAAWSVSRTGTDPRDEAAVAALARRLRLAFSPLTADYRQTVTADGVDVTEAIRTPEISQLTSTISALSSVRRVMVDLQRQIAGAAERGVVLEGRDIGTVVFPAADVKIFITASAEERARRRQCELGEKGVSASFEEVLADQKERDLRDSSRVDSPLKPAPDAVILDTDGLSIDDVVARIVGICERAQASGGRG